MSTRPTYEELLARMQQAEANPIETPPGWRDHLSVLRPTKTKVSAGIILLGAALSSISGRVFVDKLNEITQRAEQTASMRYENLDKLSEPLEIQYDPIMDYSAAGVFGGLALMVGGAIVGTVRHHETWSYRPPK